MTFNCLKCDSAVVPVDSIDYIDTTDIEDLVVLVVTCSGNSHVATNLNAIDIVMLTYPSALEGKRLRWPKFVWCVHNLLGHPIMQILALMGFVRRGIAVHEATVPRPTGRR